MVRYLFMGRKHGKAGTGRLVLLGGAEGPESNGAAAILGEPALKLRLRGVVRQAGHVQDLATLGKESADIGAGIHGPGEHIGVLMGRLGLADQAAEHASERHGFLHGTAGRRRGQSLQVEGEVVLDGGARLHSFNLEGGTDVGQRRGPEGQRLGVVLLPPLVFGAELEGPRMLQVGGQHDRLVARLARELDAQVPCLQGDEDEIQVLRRQVLRGEGIEAVDGVPEGAGVPHMFPRQGGQARWRASVSRDGPAKRSTGRRRIGHRRGGLGLDGWGGLTAQRSDRGVDGLDKHALAVKLQTQAGEHQQTGPREFSGVGSAHLIQSICIQQYPAELDDLGRVLGHVDAVLVARRGDVDDDVPVDLEGRVLLSSHGCAIGRRRARGGRRGEERGERREESGRPKWSKMEIDPMPLSGDAAWQ